MRREYLCREGYRDTQYNFRAYNKQRVQSRRPKTLPFHASKGKKNQQNAIHFIYYFLDNT